MLLEDRIDDLQDLQIRMSDCKDEKELSRMKSQYLVGVHELAHVYSLRELSRTYQSWYEFHYNK